MDEHCYVEFFYTGCKLSAEILEKLMLSKMSKYSQILNIDHNDTLDQGALLLALCRPAGPGAPARMGKGRVRELHPGGRRGSKEEGRAPYCPLMADRICGCPAAWAFSWGPCAIKVYR